MRPPNRCECGQGKLPTRPKCCLCMQALQRGSSVHRRGHNHADALIQLDPERVQRLLVYAERAKESLPIFED